MSLSIADRTYNEFKADVQEGVKSAEDHLQKRIAVIAEKLLNCDGVNVVTRFDRSRLNDYGLSAQITLEDFALAQQDSALFEKLLQRFDLRRNIEAINHCIPFFRRLNNTELGVLAQIPLSELRFAGTVYETIENTPVWFGLVDKRVLCGKLIRDIGKIRKAWRVIAARLEKIERVQPDFFLEFDYQFIDDSIFVRKVNFPLGQIRTLTNDQLNLIFSKLPKYICYCISKKTLPHIDLKRLSKSQIESLIRGDGTKSAMNRRWECLTQTQKCYVFQTARIEFLKEINQNRFNKFHYKTCSE